MKSFAARWQFTVLLLITYATTFGIWKVWPSRASFVIAGLVATTFLACRYLVAWRRGYFTDRVDVSVHGLVIFDLLLETVAFEVMRVGWPATDVQQFHNQFNFVGCTLTFATLIIAHRCWRLWRDAGQLADVAPGGSGLAAE